MRALELAKTFTEETSDPELRRLSRRLQESIAEDVLYLGNYVEGIPAPLLESYWETLSEVLSSVPDSVRIAVSRPLMDRIERLLADSPSSATLRKLLVTHTVVTES